MSIAELSRQVKDLFRKYQAYRPADRMGAFEEAQESILNILEATKDIVPEEKIIEACGDAEDPNSVSRALRNRLSPKYFEK